MYIKGMLEAQRTLDNRILERAGITVYPFYEVKLALLTELGELANEVQSFKYWKTSKTVDRKKVIEELADVLHFALSIEAEYPVFNGKIVFEDNINDCFLKVYEAVNNHSRILSRVLGLGIALGFTLKDIEIAYYEKNEINHKRQQGGY